VSGLKSVARITIGTESARYLLTVPNVDHAQTQKIIDEARLDAFIMRGKNPAIHGDLQAIFRFENEHLEISEPILHIHQFIKQESYNFDTPTINVYTR
jgi:hypothetical protein